ncbi:LutC/YkgG family protein [Roseobacter weihaiensis]|uniref:LutC/YkgG family protein n=1 Tax=Roseobacter weihaiensis TaxID=2763262 RepID=UPI001D0A056F|nr:lactate utilization protein [Roseobacter sp. H9]
MSRDAILAKIDRVNGKGDPSGIAELAAALIAEPDGFRATFPDRPTYERFVAKATSDTVTATVEPLSGLSALPAAIAAYLTENGLAQHIALQPRDSLTALDWTGFETAASARMDEPVAVTFADAGIAETGSLVFQSAPDAPVLLNFLPLHHLVVIRKDTILPHMEDAFERFGTLASDQQRSLNIITGTSGTADIEARNVRGAHGPRYMHIYIYCIDS